MYALVKTDAKISEDPAGSIFSLSASSAIKIKEVAGMSNTL